MKVGKLQDLSRNVVICWIRSQSLDKSEDVLQVYEYLLRAVWVLTDLAKSCQYHIYPGLTQLFLPILIQKGQLHISAANVREVLRYWKNNKHDTTVSLTHLKVDDIEATQYLSLVPFLGHLARLTVLVVGLSVNDDLLAVVGINCPHLTIFDAREDSGNLVTDLGLAFLRFCKKLRRIYFSSFPDEYDCALDRLSFSGKGVAMLLALPEVEQVHCSEYLLRDALIYLYQTIYCQQILSLQCLFLDHPEFSRNAIQVLPILCPKLKVVSLNASSDNVSTIGNSLRLLLHLKALVINTSGHVKFESLKLSSYGQQLTYLNISAWILDEKDLVCLSQSCSQLKTFVLNMWSFGFECINIDQTKPLFPTVEKLELVQNISVKLYKWLNLSMKNLKELHCSEATILTIDQTLNVIVENGGWQNLELLTLPMLCEISLTTAQLVVVALPNLVRFAVNISQKDEQKLSSFVDRTVPSVELIDHSEVVSPRQAGIFSYDIWNSPWSNPFRK